MDDLRVIFRGLKFNLALQAVPLADGTRADREVVVHPGSVAMLPLLDTERVVLIRNRRFSLGQTLLEIPAGTLDHGENPAACAGRELEEETGYTAGIIRRLASWFVSPGVSTERMHLYICEQLTPGPQRLMLDEQIEPVVLTRAEALERARDGRIEDAKTLLALLIWDRPGGFSPAPARE